MIKGSEMLRVAKIPDLTPTFSSLSSNMSRWTCCNFARQRTVRFIFGGIVDRGGSDKTGDKNPEEFVAVGSCANPESANIAMSHVRCKRQSDRRVNRTRVVAPLDAVAPTGAAATAHMVST